LREGNETLTSQHLERRALSVSQCAEILSEITQGEQELLETEEKRLLLRGGLNLNAITASVKPLNLEGEKDRKTSKKKGRAGGRVGRRNPKRDKTGRNDSGV
jgi:hypothetical protein